ncbi:signal peptidase I [Ulvibacter antarcticus]|uniref:Signal peptidase I n=1 Tax=Ulvibacter antarcticus TaxID=442714 RepID=A0A3L9YVZ3_9FLAO|nr:signal peptidase I [Ulvibacter antarcticus]RMA64846.1 signal peptidase I [Ulvibacter antarcticus]
MKKNHIILLILAVILIVGGIIFFFNQNLLKTYHISTTANEPALEQGTFIISSSLWKPKKNDFVLFKHKDSVFGIGAYIYRLIATEGDTLRIKNSTTFINSSNVDSSLNLKHAYFISEKQMNNVMDNPDYQEAYLTQDSYLVHLKDSIAAKNDYKRNLMKVSEPNPIVSKVYNANWNANFFGPLVIPENKIFVMGDNRDNAMDSRYIGLIDEEEIIGVVRTN